MLTRGWDFKCTPYDDMNKKSDLSFLVFEQDSFVCDDIRDTLRAAFEHCRVTVLVDLDELATTVRASINQLICILATSDDHGTGYILKLVEKAGGPDLVLLTQQWTEEVGNIGHNYERVSKPFKSETLVNAVKTLLSIPPTSQ